MIIHVLVCWFLFTFYRGGGELQKEVGDINSALFINLFCKSEDEGNDILLSFIEGNP